MAGRMLVLKALAGRIAVFNALAGLNALAGRIAVCIALADLKALAGCIAVFSALAVLNALAGFNAFAVCMDPATAWLAVASLAAAAELARAFEVDFEELLINDFFVTAMVSSP